MAPNKENLRDFLYTNAMRGNWKEVVDKYSKDSTAQGLEISQSRDTALHLAAFDNQEEVVAKLVELICRSKNQEVLANGNESGNTPLHIAAALGSMRMCSDIIASVNPRLIDIRNEDGETPLFLAALRGHKHAFLFLYSFCSSDFSRVRTNCRRKNGDTVLHCTLKNEQFDLAFQIMINLNKDVANWVNEEGLTALHILASKPTAFRSGSHIGGWRKIVYYCTFVDQLNPESAPTCSRERKTMSKPKTPSFPDNYRTCIEFFTKLWDGILIVSTLKRVFNEKKNLKNDEAENDTDLEKDVAKKSENYDADEAHERSDTRLLEAELASKPSIAIFPENYGTCISFLEIVFTGILIILGFGSIEIRKIREKKQKHTWSVQVMDKLLEFASPYKYGDDGNTPLASRLQTDDETGTRPYIFTGELVGFNTDVTHDLTDPKKEPKVVQGFKKPKDLSMSYTATESCKSEPKESPMLIAAKNDVVENEMVKKKPKDVQATESGKSGPKDSPMLIAAKNGVVEMVERIFEHFPLAIHDTNIEKKNVVLLAAEYRQPDVYMFLVEKKHLIESVFRAVDHKGNSALHLAANIGVQKPWRITGAALQMQWEVKWYRLVKESVPPQFFSRYNNEGKIPKSIFHESHKKLAKSGGEWLISTSESCSVVAALIATVAFASAATIPGGNHGEEGTPLLENEVGFLVFVLSSLTALCLSITSLVMFLAILTSRFEEKNFRSSLPRKLLVGLSSLFFSIVAMLISFCAGHFFLLSRQLKNVAVVLYTLVFLPVTLIFAIGQLPLYFDLLQAIVNKAPKRSAEVVLS